MPTPLSALTNPLRQAQVLGQSIWFDGLATPDEFRRMIEEDDLRGVTTNPSIFEKTLSSSDMGPQKKSASPVSPDEIYKTLAIAAVQDLADVFLPVYKKTCGQDGFVSIEVSPLLAYDTQATLKEARDLHKRVARKNVMIKVPATREGLPAIQTLISEGISVNVTLIFSIRRYEEVMDSYLTGLESRLKAKKDLSGIASVASFFVSRLDTEVDKLLGAGPFKEFAGKAAIANSKVAYVQFEKVFGEARFMNLKTKGAQIQRPLWASTSAKNPNYNDCLYIESLIGPQSVNTIPPPTYRAFKDHGTAKPSLKDRPLDAFKILEILKTAGIDLDKITQNLEESGVKLFSDAYRNTINNITDKTK